MDKVRRDIIEIPEQELADLMKSNLADLLVIRRLPAKVDHEVRYPLGVTLIGNAKPPCPLLLHLRNPHLVIIKGELQYPVLYFVTKNSEALEPGHYFLPLKKIGTCQPEGAYLFRIKLIQRESVPQADSEKVHLNDGFGQDQRVGGKKRDVRRASGLEGIGAVIPFPDRQR